MANSVDGQWVYTLGFDKCGIVTPNAPGNENGVGIAYYEYDLYLNFDQNIDAADGNGNIQQLGQTKLTCKGLVVNFDNNRIFKLYNRFFCEYIQLFWVPANIQENAAQSIVTITDDDIVPDLPVEYEIFKHLSLGVFKRATAFDSTAAFDTRIDAASSSVKLGEDVQLKIIKDTTYTALTSPFV